MPLPGISIGSIEKSLQRVDRTDFGSVLSFIEKLEASLVTDRENGRVISCASLKVREVFELFGFSNDFIDIGRRREYQIPEMRLNLSTPSAHLKPRDHELLKSIANVWPPANESKVRLFVSMMIHFAIEQVNSETEAQSTKDSESLSVPRSPAPGSKPGTPPKPSIHKSFPVILKAYTEALVSWETTDSANRKVIVKGLIDYGVSHAQKTPESLESFFTIVETKGADEMNDRSWAQLLAYMGIIQKSRKKAEKFNTTIYGLLTDGLKYEFSKISNGSKVSRSRRFSAATDLGYIYMYLSHCLRSIIRSSPTSSPSKPQDVGEEVARYSEIVQPKYVYDFEIIDVDEEDMIDME